MSDAYLRVTRAPDGVWSVTDGRAATLRTVSHRLGPALAYGRAFARSERKTLFVDGPDGAPVKQSRASLTYPITLD